MPSISPAQMTDRLKTEGEKTVEFFNAIPPDKWKLQIYTDGENWTIHQILTHIAQAEDSVLRLISHVVKGGSGAPEKFDLNTYNHRKVNENQETRSEDLISQFVQRRANTLSFVSNLTDEDMQKVGRHPFIGVATVEEMLKTMHLHTQLHRRDIRKLLGQG